MFVTIVHLDGDYKHDIVGRVGCELMRTDPEMHKIDVQFDTLQFRFKVMENHIVIRNRSTREYSFIFIDDFCNIQIEGGGDWRYK